MIGQTWAILLDAYRELNAKKLFWVATVVSVVVVAACACLGIGKEGLTVLWFNIPIKFMADLYQYGIIDKPFFYKLLFQSVGYNIWLSWAAIILALLTTAGMMPDFVTSGSIELTLSRPIGRLRLFLTKYFAGMLFVAMQVTVFTGLSFLAIGLRGGGWLWTLWWGVPLVSACFSFIYCLMVLVGLLTRSSMAALLAAAVFWLSIFLINTVESGILLQLRTREDIKLSLQRTKLQEITATLDSLKNQAAELDATSQPAGDPSSAAPGDAPASPAERSRKADDIRSRIERARSQVATWETRIDESKKSLDQFVFYHEIFFATKTLLPKTSETMGLLGRWLIPGDQMDNARRRGESLAGTVDFNDNDGGVRIPQRQIAAEMEKHLRERSVMWVLGSSLLFEVVIVAITAWIFCRRDF